MPGFTIINMAYKDLPDHQLLEDCRQGNDKAFNILFQRYFNKLHFFALKFIKDRALTEELVMDIITRLWEKRENFNTETELGPYLFRALKNAIIDEYRKKELEVVEIEQVPEKYFVGNSTDDRFCLEELKSVYHVELGKLSPQRRKVFEMSRHRDMTYSEIANDLNLSVKTVESHVSAALIYLRKSLRTYTNTFLTLIFLIFLG